MFYQTRSIAAQSPQEAAWRSQEYKRLRTALNLTSVELSVVTGLSLSTIRQIPTLKKIPSLLVLERMRAALEVRKNQMGE